MAYTEHQVKRIEGIFKRKRRSFEGKKFMGGFCFFLDDKMCIGLDIDKKTGKDRLLARIGEEAMRKALLKKGSRPMDITGKPMKGFVFVDPEGFEHDKDLEYWVQLSIDFNPLAKSSKKK